MTVEFVGEVCAYTISGTIFQEVQQITTFYSRSQAPPQLFVAHCTVLCMYCTVCDEKLGDKKLGDKESWGTKSWGTKARSELLIITKLLPFLEGKPCLVRLTGCMSQSYS